MDQIKVTRPKTGHFELSTTSRESYVPHAPIMSKTPEPKMAVPGMKFRGKSSYAEQFRNAKLDGCNENAIFGPVERKHRRD